MICCLVMDENWKNKKISEYLYGVGVQLCGCLFRVLGFLMGVESFGFVFCVLWIYVCWKWNCCVYLLLCYELYYREICEMYLLIIVRCVVVVCCMCVLFLC